MSLSYATIKIEPEFSCGEENNENTNDVYDKQVLDLSKKNTGADENGENSPEIEPEFVNIKMEVDYDNSIKEEPKSDEENCNLPSNWESVQAATRTEPIDYTNNGRTFEVAIKKEEIEVTVPTLNYVECKYSNAPVQPNTSHEDYNNVSEDSLNLNTTIDGKYMCPICHKRFASKSNVQRHQILHSKSRLKCHICSRTFVKAGHLEKHVLSHSNVKLYTCQDCGKEFKTSSNLDQHKVTHLAIKPFKCEICLKQFSVKANLVKHQEKNRCKRPSDQPIVCNVCNKVFKREFLLRSHLRRHTTEKPYTCEMCDMNFKYKSTLIRHIQLHNGIKPYSCKICKKRFTHAGLIKPHMRKHTGEKPYQCPICLKMFAHKHNMERHTLRHAKIKHLVCDICHKKFPKESRLVYHMRIHTNDKPFSCKICPKKFTHRQNVVRHYGRKHPGEVYDSPETDASVAREAWESAVLQRNLKKELEAENGNEEYVIP